MLASAGGTSEGIGGNNVARLISDIKQKALSFVGDTNAPRKILWGVNRGVRMNLDLASDTQTYVGIAERELATHFERLSRDIQTAIDVGGSVGFYTLFFLTKTSAKQVFCFEPDAGCYQQIATNLRLNGLDDTSRLRLVEKFVGSSDTDDHATLDSIADDVSAPCLVKIDVEGAEVDVLKGARRLLSKPGVRWIIETHSAALERECIEIMRNAGLTHEIVGKAGWRVALPEVRPAEHNRWLIAW